MTGEIENSQKRVMPPVYFLITLLLIAAVPWVLPISTLIHAPLKYAGLLIIGIGLVVVVVPARAFETHATTIRPFEDSYALMTDGFYRLTRKPMYLGMAIVLIGIAILLGLTSFLPMPFFMIMIQQRFVLMGEAMPAERFGDRYAEYCRSVRRWI